MFVHERWLSEKSEPLHNILGYVSSFSERLHKAVEQARGALSSVQTKRHRLCDQITRSKKSSQVCNINMLKLYIACQAAIASEHSFAHLTCVLPIAVPPAYCPKEDKLCDHQVTAMTTQLENSKFLASLDDYLSYLCMPAWGDVN